MSAAPSPDPLATELLLALLSAAKRRDDATTIAAKLGETGWEAFGRLAHIHGVAGVTRERLRDLSLPASIAESLRQDEVRATALGLTAQRECRVAVGVLRESGCERVAPLKGAHLLPCLYERAGARSINDVDLLISEEDSGRAHEGLIAAGYTFVPKPIGRPASQRVHYERTYISPRSFVVDVHTALCQKERIGLDYDAMWDRATLDSRLNPWGEGLVALDPVDTLLVLAVHLAQDAYRGALRQWVDLSWWLTRARPSLPCATERAEQAGATTALWIALWIARDRMGAVIPSAALARTAPGAVRRSYLRRLLGGSEPHSLSPRWPLRMAQALTLLPVMDGHRRRLRFSLGYAALRVSDWITTEKRWVRPLENRSSG